MKRVEQFRANAQKCRDLAVGLPPEDQAQLALFADHWDALADESEKALPSGGTPGNNEPARLTPFAADFLSLARGRASKPTAK